MHINGLQLKCFTVIQGMVEKKYAVGVDIGGTWLRVAVFDIKGSLVEKIPQRVDTSRKDAIAKQIVTLIKVICRRNRINSKSLQGVGIASTGPLDMAKGELIEPVNLPFDNVPLTKPITRELDVPAYLVNDCTGAVLGENMFGAGQGLDNLVYITIGTGVGGGAIVDGSLLLGKDGNAVEVGHLTIDYEGRLTCGCGKKGHWEAYCSGKNIPNFVRMRIKETSEKTVNGSLLFKKAKDDFSSLHSEDLFNAAKKGDSLSLQLVEEIGILNAIGFANIINAYDPSLITLGGAVALKNEKLILPYIKRYVGEHALNRVPEIIMTPLGEDVGICGGVAAALKFSSSAKP
jgi:glucokinase